MKISHNFEYDVTWPELSEEFASHDSEYQAKALNAIGEEFKVWLSDETKTMTHVQLLEIAEQLNDNGKWFIKTLCEYM